MDETQYEEDVDDHQRGEDDHEKVESGEEGQNVGESHAIRQEEACQNANHGKWILKLRLILSLEISSNLKSKLSLFVVDHMVGLCLRKLRRGVSQDTIR